MNVAQGAVVLGVGVEGVVVMRLRRGLVGVALVVAVVASACSMPPSGPGSVPVLVAGVGTPVPALAAAGSTEWSYTAGSAGLLDLALRGGEESVCPSVLVLDAGGAVVGSLPGCGNDGVQLPAAGSYKVRVTAGTVAVGAGAFTLWASTPSAGPVVQLGGEVAVPGLVPGQRARLVFTGTRDQVVSFLAVGASDLDVRLVRLGVTVATSSSDAAPGAVLAKTPVSGDFSVEVFNTGTVPTSSTAVSLFSSVQALAGTVPAAAPALSAGGSAAWAVNAPGSEVVITATDPARCVFLRVSDADGVTGERAGCGGTHLPAPSGAGTVEVLNLTPSPAAAGSATVATVAPLAGGTIPNLGSVTSPAASRGQSVTFTHTPAGSGIRVVRVTGPGGSCRSVTVTAPDGTETATGSGCGSSGATAVGSFDAGTGYTVSVSDGSDTGTAGPVTATVLAPTDIDAGALQANQTATSPALAAGQRPVWSYPSAAGPGLGELVVTYNGPGCAIVGPLNAGSDSALGEVCNAAPLNATWLASGDDVLSVTPLTPTTLPAAAITVSFTPSTGTPPAAQRDTTSDPGPAAATNAAGPTANSVGASSTACADVLFVGARGSGELPGSQVYGKPAIEAVGTRVKAVYEAVKRRLDRPNLGVTIELSPLYAYPANGVELLTPGSSFNPPRYFDGIDLGRDEGVATLEGFERNCPNQRIVLSGYSQGAMVIHRIINKLDSLRRDSILRRIDGAVLLADGDRRGKTREAIHYGSADRNSTGISWTAGDLACTPRTLTACITPTISPSGAYKAKLPLKMRTRVHSVCFKYDSVCDTTVRKFSQGNATHGGFLYKDAVFWASATDAVVDRILRQPNLTRALATPLTGVKQVTVGTFHSCALLDSGQARCWGDGGLGALGDGTNGSSLTPVPVGGSSPLTGIKQIDGGSGHTCAVLETGQGRCWGENRYGQLGRSGPGSSSPVVVGGVLPLEGIKQIASGFATTCAVLTNGQARCWGAGAGGQLGDGTTQDSAEPVVVGGATPLTGVTQIAVGSAAACALLDSGQARCWGSGPVGDGTNGPSLTPVPVGGSNPLTGIAQISAGIYNMCAVLASSQARCWGGSTALGDGTTLPSLIPVVVGGSNPLTGITQIASGVESTCARLETGQARCWGSQSGYGLLGDGTTVGSLTPVAVGGGTPLSGVTQLDLQWFHACARLDNGQIRCWGDNYGGQLGNGERSYGLPLISAIPVPVLVG